MYQFIYIYTIYTMYNIYTVLIYCICAKTLTHICIKYLFALVLKY